MASCSRNIYTLLLLPFLLSLATILTVLSTINVKSNVEEILFHVTTVSNGKDKLSTQENFDKNTKRIRSQDQIDLAKTILYTDGAESVVYNVKSVPVFTNTKAWLDGPRLSNANETLMAEKHIRSLIIMNSSPLGSTDGSKDLLSYSLCPDNSNFMDWRTSSKEALEKDEVNIKSLAFRLMFLAIHESQHKPARAEAIARYNEEGSLRNYTNNLPNIGKFDFECDPGTKYIITTIPGGKGVGHSLRYYATEALLFGLITKRVVLLFSETSVGHARFQKKFWLTSCDRKDLQCKFMPMSPCVITKQDIIEAIEMPAEELKTLRATGKLSEAYVDKKVLSFFSSNFHEEPKGTRDAFVSIIRYFYNRERFQVKETIPSPPWNIDDEMLQRVIDYILDFQTNRWIPWHAAIMYMMRPNMLLKEELHNISEKSIPSSVDLNRAIGIPIRDGDKCEKESQCMSFENYMQLAQEMAIKRTIDKRGGVKTATITSSNSMYDTIILSSESKHILQARFEYTNNESFPFKVLANNEDVAQGHGRPYRYSTMGKYTADGVMVASMAAIKMQLLSETLVLNSCSNFHKLIETFYTGCGRDEVGYMEWLSQNDNPKFRLGCKHKKK